MIAIDTQPFSFTSDQGFIDLLATLEPGYLIASTKFFTNTMLPHTLEISVQTNYRALFLLFISDTWANSKTKTSYFFNCALVE